MKAWTIAVTNLRRTLRARANIFFIFVFPMLLILVLGATFGGSGTPRLGVVITRLGPLSGALLRQLERTPDLRVERVTSDSAMLALIECGNLSAGLEVPANYNSAIRQGRTAELNYLARPGHRRRPGRPALGHHSGKRAVLSARSSSPSPCGSSASPSRPALQADSRQSKLVVTRPDHARQYRGYLSQARSRLARHGQQAQVVELRSVDQLRRAFNDDTGTPGSFSCSPRPAPSAMPAPGGRAARSSTGIPLPG